jgi:hypothetical protein
MLNGAAAADDDDDSVLHSASGVDGKKTHNSLCTEANKVGNLFLFTLVFFACPEEASMLPFVSFETIFFRKKKNLSFENRCQYVAGSGVLYNIKLV